MPHRAPLPACRIARPLSAKGDHNPRLRTLVAVVLVLLGLFGGAGADQRGRPQDDRPIPWRLAD
ncbi:hypothetical protein [Gemmobacter nectariphilus]|uniref:hypothetical protein n=1 Tax=Gemmobacter nectariphilus TaxID=220343 RepID=UPI00040FF7DC|nr:hypothetical protein [Gemmobacter nectariphilus]